MQLISTETGPTGVKRTYHHPRHGRLTVVTTWRDEGAHIIHFRADDRPSPFANVIARAFPTAKATSKQRRKGAAEKPQSARNT